MEIPGESDLYMQRLQKIADTGGELITLPNLRRTEGSIAPRGLLLTLPGTTRLRNNYLPEDLFGVCAVYDICEPVNSETKAKFRASCAASFGPVIDRLRETSQIAINVVGDTSVEDYSGNDVLHWDPCLDIAGSAFLGIRKVDNKFSWHLVVIVPKIEAGYNLWVRTSLIKTTLAAFTKTNLFTACRLLALRNANRIAAHIADACKFGISLERDTRCVPRPGFDYPMAATPSYYSYFTDAGPIRNGGKGSYAEQATSATDTIAVYNYAVPLGSTHGALYYVGAGRGVYLIDTAMDRYHNQNSNAIPFDTLADYMVSDRTNVGRSTSAKDRVPYDPAVLQRMYFRPGARFTNESVENILQNGYTFNRKSKEEELLSIPADVPHSKAMQHIKPFYSVLE